MRANKGAELFMLSVVVVAVVSLEVQTPQKRVEVGKGTAATLPCTFQSTHTPTATDYGAWTKVSSNDEFVNWYFDGGKEPSYIGQKYKNRVNFTGNPSNNDLTITLNDVAMDDNGTYECSVRLRSELPVRSALMDLVVLVIPSIPECKIIGTTEYGHNINLTCHSVEGYPKPQYSWKRFDVQNQQKELTGVVVSEGLTLKNISADTSGFYICTSANSIGSNFCNMTVSVSPPSMNIALYAGIIGAIVAAIIVIGIIAYCCCCRNQKDKDYEMTETENGYQPPPNEPVRIRGPADEEVQEEDEQQEEDRWKSKPLMPPTPKPEVVA